MASFPVEHSIAHTWGQAELTKSHAPHQVLPEAIIAKRPALSAFLGWTWLWLGYGSERIFPLLERAEKQLGMKSNSALGRFNVIRSFIVRIRDNNASNSVRLARLALSQLSADNSLWRGFANMSLAIAAFIG